MSDNQNSPTSEDCPCCHECLAPGADTDRALVAAFIGGVAARDFGAPLAMVLCTRHARLAGECAAFVIRNAEGRAS